MNIRQVLEIIGKLKQIADFWGNQNTKHLLD
jgi:hypothetical protein